MLVISSSYTRSPRFCQRSSQLFNKCGSRPPYYPYELLKVYEKEKSLADFGSLSHTRWECKYFTLPEIICSLASRLTPRRVLRLGNIGRGLGPVLVCQVKEAGGHLDAEIDHPGARIAKDIGGDPLPLNAANRVFDIDPLFSERRVEDFFVVGKVSTFRLFEGIVNVSCGGW